MNWIEKPFYLKLEIMAKLNDACENSQAFQEGLEKMIEAAEQYKLIKAQFNINKDEQIQN